MTVVLRATSKVGIYWDNLWDNRCDNHGIKPGVEITSGIYSDRPNSDGLKKHLQAFKSLRSQRKREPHTWVSSKSKRSKSGSESSSSSSSSCSKLPILRNSESWCYSPKLNRGMDRFFSASHRFPAPNSTEFVPSRTSQDSRHNSRLQTPSPPGFDHRDWPLLPTTSSPHQWFLKPGRRASDFAIPKVADFGNLYDLKKCPIPISAVYILINHHQIPIYSSCFAGSLLALIQGWNEAGGNTQGIDCEQLSMSKRTEDNLFYVLLGYSWEIIGYK